MRRVLLLNNIPAPYFDPLFAKLAEAHDWVLRVCYASTWNRNAGWVEKPLRQTNYEVVVLDRLHEHLTRRFGSSISAAMALFDEMNRERPDYALIYGYTLLPQCLAILWASLVGIPFAVIGDANFHADTARGVRRVVKRLWLKVVISQASALINIGRANRRFWESYGAPPQKLFTAGYAVDNEHIASEINKARAGAAALRSELKLEAGTVFLFVGRLVKRKNVDLIIRAMKKIDSTRIALVVVGDGEERTRLETLADKDPRIVFCGAVSQSELPRYYAIGDVLVLPASDEPWGLVVNEAMAGGLAVIAHEHCGAAVDLVANDNGAALKTLSVDELAASMFRIAADQALLEEMKGSSLRKIQDWSIEGAARGIIEAVSQTSPDAFRDSRPVREAK
jgi:glycosyltransferase involved in cell wall biosynthesis